jgi:prevent-host-death family protein
MQYGLAQAKARLSELASLVDSGEEVIIAKHGRPSYRLISIQSTSAHGLPLVEKTPGPSSLRDMASFIAEYRYAIAAKHRAGLISAKNVAAVANALGVVREAKFAGAGTLPTDISQHRNLW